MAREIEPTTIWKWPDLSKYGLDLRRVITTAGESVLVLRGAREVDEKLFKRLGFKNDGKGNWYRRHGADEQPSVYSYKSVFPDCEPVTRAVAEITDDHRNPTSAARRTDGSAPAVDAGEMSRARPLGQNRARQQILALADGRRFLKNQGGNIVHEADIQPPQPGLFLRATDQDSLAVAAEGLMREVETGRILREDELTDFARTAFSTEQPSERQISDARSALAGAAGRWLGSKTKVSLRDIYNSACSLQETVPILFALEEREGASLPLAVAAQRLAGTSAELSGRTLFVPDIGGGEWIATPIAGARTVVGGTAPGAQSAAKATASASAGRSEVVQSGAGPQAHDVTLVGTPFGADMPLRERLAAIEALLDRRAADGRSVIAVRADGPDADELLVGFQKKLGRGYVVEGVADVDGALAAGRPGASSVRMMTLGSRRPTPLDVAPEEALRVREIGEYGGLWTWVSEMAASRMRADAPEVGLSLGGRMDGTLARNEYQAPYQPASRAGVASTMVPRALEGATREALGRVVKRYGDLDQLVATEFGYPKEELGEVLSVEQIDVLGLYVHADDRGRGLLIADQAGVGKGRTQAAIARREVLRDKKVVYLTEKPMNFSDVYRDLAHTRSTDLVKPLILNDGANIIDETTGGVVLKGANAAAMKKLIADGRWPDDNNLMMGSYSTLNKLPLWRSPEGKVVRGIVPPGPGHTPADRAAFLISVIDKDTVVILDECHNASSGESNTANNVNEIVRRAGNVVYASATFGRNAKSMSFFHRLLPEGMSADKLAEMLMRGGETIQEIFSTMLVADGVMVRREHDLSSMEFTTIHDPALAERNRMFMDLLAPILGDMAQLQQMVERKIREINNRAVEPAEADPEDGARRKPSVFRRTGFGSPLQTLSKLFVTAINTDLAIERSLSALAEGEKPIIVADSTIEKLLTELAEDEDALEGSRFPNFSTLVQRTVTRLCSISSMRADGSRFERDLSLEDVRIADMVGKLRTAIDAIPDLPISAIDVVKTRIRDAGYTCDEITGRGVEIEDGRVVRRPNVDKVVVKNAFNNGDVDALVINKSGSTGIDLHASKRFKDQRKRVMIELEPAADVLKQVQTYGRAARYDQVVGPRIETLNSGLPIEVRNAAIRNARLRKLSANVTSNRDSSLLIRDIPDLLNEVGDIVCTRYAEARPDLMRRLGYQVFDHEDSEDANRETQSQQAGLDALVGRRSANEFMARLVVLPVAMQEQVVNELVAEYLATLEELEAKGETPLKRREMAGIVQKTSRSVFEGAAVEHADSAFLEPLYVYDAIVERELDPMRSDQLMQAMEMGLTSASANRGRTVAEHLERNRDVILEAYLSDKFANVEEALQRGDRRMHEQKNRIERLAEVLKDLAPGREIFFGGFEEGDVVRGVVTAIHHPPRGFEHVAAQYSVEFVSPGDVEPRRIKLRALLGDPVFKVGLGLEDNKEYDKILRRFDDSHAVKLDTVKLLGGNLFRAMKHVVDTKIGQLVVYRTTDGKVEAGVQVSRRNRMMDVPVELDGPAMSIACVKERAAELRSTPDLSPSGITITPRNDGAFDVVLPLQGSRRHGYIYENSLAKQLLAKAVAEPGKQPRLIAKSEEIGMYLTILHEAGAHFWTSPALRGWSTDYLTRKSTANTNDENGPRLLAAGGAR
ncbi:strawberry notch C-terminal domain-containing protein [Methylobacterium fujisawaense]|jgi:hypothetical protein